MTRWWWWGGEEGGSPLLLLLCRILFIWGPRGVFTRSFLVTLLVDYLVHRCPRPAAPTNLSILSALWVTTRWRRSPCNVRRTTDGATQSGGDEAARGGGGAMTTSEGGVAIAAAVVATIQVKGSI